MAKAKYDWRVVDKALMSAQCEIYAAIRHMNHRKRVNLLNDVVAALSDLTLVFNALGARPVIGPVVGAGDPHAASTVKLTTRD